MPPNSDSPVVFPDSSIGLTPGSKVTINSAACTSAELVGLPKELALAGATPITDQAKAKLVTEIRKIDRRGRTWRSINSALI